MSPVKLSPVLKDSSTKKEMTRREESKERDRGPFGGGSPIEYGDGDTSDEDEKVFQKGSTTPAKSSQQRLLRYAKKYPDWHQDS